MHSAALETRMTIGTKVVSALFPSDSMAIGTIDRTEALTPTSIKAPKTWGDLQTLNSLIPSHFQEARYAALTGENGKTFGTLDSTLVRAVWSRRDTDNPGEALPAHLQKAAAEMLELMNVRQPENILQRSIEGGRQVFANIGSLVTSLRQKMGGTTVDSASK